MSTPAKIYLKSRHCGPALGRHPWVFSDVIEKIDGEPKDGDEVKVFGEGKFIATGFFNSKSQIRIRLLAWEDRSLDESFFAEKIKAAYELRKQIGLVKADAAYRFIYSEGDGLSGLVADRFGDYLVLQITSLALYERRHMIAKILEKIAEPKGIFLKAEKNISTAEGLSSEDEILFGKVPEAAVEVAENDIRFEVNFLHGQKTGFYCDQRDNRKAAAALVKGKKVLDLYSYTGAFAMNFAKAGAKEIIAVDSSKGAIEQAQKNAKLNGISNIDFQVNDAFDWLKENADKKFDLIVLDPPRFAPSRGAKEKALRTYFKINEEALKAISPGGYLVTCSCSGQISREDFAFMLAGVARRSKRFVQVLEQRGQAADHPVLTACPETDYLKTFICRVL
ncbi:MAG: class I SAM-dependent rRNA methyltransferase [Deltaproteobacteria bacterium]|nr:class I SAM-dependent rRNA methyltransferase [Deltaproteobacteria bacterium]